MISDYRWSEETNGLLMGMDKWRFYSLLVRGQCHEMIQKLLTACGGYQKAIARINLDSIPEPDSQIAREAQLLASVSCKPELYLHCLRTYYFAAMYAQFTGEKPDLELLYVASLMHDIGLTDDFQSQAASNSFAVVGAREAYALAEKYEYGTSWRIALYEAISKHLNPFLSAKQNSIEARSLQKGATLDVIGGYQFLFPKAELAKVHQRYSRDGFKAHILDTMTDIPHHKCSHAGVLCSCGFEGLVDKNPLEK
ncbi:HD domain-containing protein [Thaumasiovibrio subtropicus]|uniref:HD domain-containing protein n=1 Tax=Thaumasiovibrio subtropicus TaxID=1891207 RepID=UPI000B3636A4|nr:HD domain-containing protein [Thaumasiovibrio subtropicus]